jgi:hypothetical protein
MYEELNLNSKIDEKNDINNKKCQLINVSHNASLNCLFILTEENKLILFDCNTRSRLKVVDWSTTKNDDTNQSHKRKFIRVYNLQEKCVIVSDWTLCCRSTHDGLLLLDTVFQTPSNLSSCSGSITSGSSTSSLSNEKQNVRTLELHLNDAVTLLNALKSIEIDVINGLEDIIKQIEKQFADARQEENPVLSFDCSNTVDNICLQLDNITGSNISDPWTTIRITDDYSNLLVIFTQVCSFCYFTIFQEF